MKNQILKQFMLATLCVGALLPLACAQAQRLESNRAPGLWDGSTPGPQGKQGPSTTYGVGAGSGVLLDFEGLAGTEAVLSFYNGGFGSAGSGPGPAFGTTFTSNGLALTSGNYKGNPSPPTILFWTSGPNTFLNRAAGFTGEASFYYSAASNAGVVTLHSEVSGGGSLLATVVLPITPTLPGSPTTFNNWQQVIIPFAGTARSIGFGGTANQIGFDDVVLGSLGSLPDCELLGVVGVWGEEAGRCGNFSSNATSARYESAIHDSAPPTRGAVGSGEYSYEVEMVANRPRQPSASVSVLVSGSPYPLRTATQNWDRAFAFNITHNGKYSIFRYNGPGLPVAVQSWVTPVGVTINRAPASNVLRVERVSAGAGFNLRYFINGVMVRELPDTLGVDQFGTGFVRSIPTTGNPVTDDWLDVLNIELDDIVATRGIPASRLISREQQQANDAANASRGNSDPLFAPLDPTGKR